MLEVEVCNKTEGKRRQRTVINMGLVSLGSAVCDELQEFGAGSAEGWLELQSLVSISPPLTAFASPRSDTVLIVDWDGYASPVKIRPSMQYATISAIEWLTFSSHSYRILALGTSKGSLLLFSSSGDLLHHQMLYSSPIVRFRLRTKHTALSHENSLASDFCVIFSTVIVLVDSSSLQSLLRRSIQGSGSSANNPDEHKLVYQIWSFSKYGPCIDAAITGIMPPPLFEDQPNQQYYSAVTIGADATFGAFRLSAERSKSLVGAILSRVMPVTVSTITSFTKMFWRSGQPSTKSSEYKPQAFAGSSMVTCLKDNQRKGERLALSPSGSLAVVTDSLGRILLLDTQSLIVIRMWKGYRDASCFFLEVPIHDNISAIYDNDVTKTKHDFCLCLAIHAPRRSVVEVWKMRTGPRIMTFQCPKGCRLLQPAANLSYISSDVSNYTPAKVYILNGDSGQISLLNAVTKLTSQEHA